jgi:catechol 2,3-dioxygenase-like lactoylglutathione lyase family enzyme
MIEASPSVAQLPAHLRPRGVHHLVLNTDDMKRTIDFYTEVMGMPLAHVERVPPGVGTANNRGNPPFEEIRHYFFDMGNDSLLAFFEIPKGAREPVDRDGIGGMQHCAFAVTAAGADGLLARLRAHGVGVLGPIEPLPGLMSAYFFDCNGIRLEMCWRPIDLGDTTNVLASVRQTRADALRELAGLSDDQSWLDRVTSGFSE